MIASILTTILVIYLVALLLAALVSGIDFVGKMLGKLFTIEFFYMLVTVISGVLLVLIGTALVKTFSLSILSIWLCVIAAYIALQAVNE